MWIVDVNYSFVVTFGYGVRLNSSFSYIYNTR